MRPDLPHLPTPEIMTTLISIHVHFVLVRTYTTVVTFKVFFGRVSFAKSALVQCCASVPLFRSQILKSNSVFMF